MYRKTLFACILLLVLAGCKDKLYERQEIGYVVYKLYDPQHSVNLYSERSRPVFVPDRRVGKYNLVILCDVTKEVYHQFFARGDERVMVTFYLQYDPAKLYRDKSFKYLP